MAIEGIERLGLTEEEAELLGVRFHELVKTMPKERTNRRSENGNVVYDLGHHFLDWEAALLRKVLAHFKSVDPDVCALMRRLVQESDHWEEVDYKFSRSLHLKHV